MTTLAAHPLISSVDQPETPEELAERIRAAAPRREAIYPLGGGTNFDMGLPIRRPGTAIDLTRLDRVIDYPAADMTITVQAGIRMAELDRLLSQQGQQLPLDVPAADRATLGGVLATNSSGPRRFGYGTARDYVIGIRAVDGRGSAFAGGGRVVKNVAGYDLCKLLIGSLGTLAVTTEVTLKLKPRAPRMQAIVVAPSDLSQLDQLLAQLTQCRVQASAVEWLVGNDWQPLAAAQNWPDAERQTGWLWLLLEGMEEEVDWMRRTLEDRWRQSFGLRAMPLDDHATAAGLRELTEFPAGPAGGIVLKAIVRPSATVSTVRPMAEEYSSTTIQAHAASGVIYLRWPETPSGNFMQSLISRWQPATAAAGGNMVILRAPSGLELTRRAVWGTLSGPLDLMQRIKKAFDPHDILNPERFVY